MNSNKTSYAKIELNLGGSIQELVLDHKTIIKNNKKVPYSISYASSILFPFVNRIKNGQYRFEGETYTLEKNLAQESNVLHGLVYNKTFEFLKDKKTQDYCSVTLQYDEKKGTKGFPYKHTIYLTYVLTKDSLELKVNIKNYDVKTFPFNIGWHPYFLSSNLNDSSLKISSSKKLSFNKHLKLIKNKNILLFDYFQIGKSEFDDCFVLNTKEMYFKTPDYKIRLNSSAEENYLQVYTPPNSQQIALEPMTGFANSFNHTFGFQRLKPKEIFSVNWKINLI